MFSTATTIAIEGPDQVGKATQTKLLADRLRSNGHRVKTLEAPLQSVLTYKIIYWMLRNGAAKKYPNVFQFVHFLNKLWYQLTLFHFDRRAYDFILFDRWSLSSLVYGSATGTNARFMTVLYNALRKPDTNVIILSERFDEAARDVYEKDSDLQQKVRKGFHDWSCYSANVAVRFGTQPREQVHEFIWRALDVKGLL